MKSRKIIISIAAICVLMSGGFAASTSAKKVKLDETEIGLRKVDLYSEDYVKPNGTNYHKDAPGTSKKFDRAYMNAPPMIPHDIDDLGEIDKNNNACLGCHMPDVADSMGATPIPKTHFTSFRPVVEVDDKDNAKLVGNDMFVKKDLEGKLWQGRFNCTQCHAPQTQGKLNVASKFQKDCPTTSTGKSHLNKSYLMDEIEIGVKNSSGL